MARVTIKIGAAYDYVHIAPDGYPEYTIDRAAIRKDGNYGKMDRITDIICIATGISNKKKRKSRWYKKA